MSDVVELTRELVALNTVNPDLEPGAPGERPAVEHLANRLRRSGFEIAIIGPPDRPSLLATHRGTATDARTLALNGHLDTVPAGGMADPFTPRIEGDRLYGRGTCDMKAGIAALVVAAEHAARLGTQGDIVLALVADEEHGSLGTTAVLEHLGGRVGSRAARAARARAARARAARARAARARAARARAARTGLPWEAERPARARRAEPDGACRTRASSPSRRGWSLRARIGGSR